MRADPTSIYYSVRVQMLRKQLGLSCYDLSLRSGVSMSMIRQVESGQSVPGLDVAERLAAGLGMTLGGLLADDGTETRG